MSVNYVQKRFVSEFVRKWAYSISRFNRYGLMRDDCHRETEEVIEALRRLPQHEIDARNYRILRAIQLSIQKDILPKEQWTKYEDDRLYLTPLIEEVIKEKKEEKEWNKNY